MRTLVLGMGCILMRDDGVGPSALATFASLYELPDDVELLDIGTPGPELAHQISGCGAAVHSLRRAPCAIAAGHRPVLDAQRDPRRPPLNPRLSHDPGLREALLTAEFFGEAPCEVLLVGIVPKQIELGTELSPEVRARGLAARRGSCGIGAPTRLGVLPVPRHEPALEEVWWRSA